MPKRRKDIKHELEITRELLEKGHLAKAIKRAKALGQKHPIEPSFPRIVGLAYSEMGKSKLACTFFERAWKLDKKHPELIQNFALSLISDGQHMRARKFLEQIETSLPLTPRMLFLKALATFSYRDDRKALEILEEALQKDPEHLEATLLKAEILLELREPNAALFLVEDFLDKNRHHHEAHLRHAKICLDFGDVEKAFDAVNRAMGLAPNHAETLRLLSEFPNLSEEDLSGLEEKITRELKSFVGTENESAAILHFAAANVSRRRGRIERELDFLEKANAIWLNCKTKSEPVAHYKTRDIPYLNIQKASKNPADLDVVPIFVVGLPRSGTTLVEQILGSHSAVQPMGELTLTMRWDRYHGSDAARIAPTDAFSKYYWDELPQIPSTASAFVDKMPGNYKYLGLIARAFPNAVILNVTRDPRDVALSLWRTLFAAEGMSYAQDWEAMANEANYYSRCMKTWHEIMPNCIHDVSYEALVTDKESEIRRLAELCGLTFERGMLEPHLNAGLVRSASQVQVRQPVKTQSIGNWKAHEDSLSSFISDLDRDLWPQLQTNI